MTEFTREELRDIMHAIRHYQIYHVSINNERYEEYNKILEKFERKVAATDQDLNNDHFDKSRFCNWLELRQAEIDVELSKDDNVK